MKKILIITLVLVQSVTGAYAQFEKGDVLLNGGISFGSYGYYDHWDHSWDHSFFPPLSLSIEKGVHEYFSVGVIAGFFSHSYRSNLYDYYHNYTYYSMGGYLSFHYTPFVEEGLDLMLTDIDLYVSLCSRMEFRMYSYKYFNPAGHLVDDADTKVFLRIGPLLGGRYYFTDKFAVFGEIGWGGAFGVLTLGGTIKL